MIKIREVKTTKKYQEKCEKCRHRMTSADLRYVVEIKTYAHPDIEPTAEDLSKDFEQELKRLYKLAMKKNKHMLMEEVWTGFRFILCAACRKKLLSDLKFARRSQIHPY